MLSNSLTLSPNSTRTLGEKLSLNGISYQYAYTFNTAGWLTGAARSSSDNSLSTNWN